MKNHLKLKVAGGVLLIIVGISFLISDFVSEEREQVFSRVNVELNDLLAKEATVDENNTEENETVVEENVVQESQEEVVDAVEIEAVVEAPVETRQYETFAGVLEIPKINFSRGFYQKGSELNDVKFNLKILDASSYPGEERGNVIIIGHSGNYSNSYFGNLYQLSVSDIASIQYQGKKYNYKIVNIYNEEKDGTVTIYRDETKNCLTLITCTKDDDTKQTVYILEQYSVE